MCHHILSSNNMYFKTSGTLFHGSAFEECYIFANKANISTCYRERPRLYALTPRLWGLNGRTRPWHTISSHFPLWIQAPIFLNGVCRHERRLYWLWMTEYFLNGVCRHERCAPKFWWFKWFLNGVCRHELYLKPYNVPDGFLNGVCRHEPKLPSLHHWYFVSKWRMSPWTAHLEFKQSYKLSKWRMSPWTAIVRARALL